MKAKSNSLVGAGIISAIAASLCCITPVLALISGTSGVASTFSWMEPFKPYLIGFTVLVLIFAWYNKLKTKKEVECDCDENEKPKFIQSKTFLSIITIFAGIMLAFPYYSHLFYPNTNKQVVYVSQTNVGEIQYKIEGMTCLGCEAHIENEVNALEGIIEVSADYKNASTSIKYDKTKVSEKALEKAILKTGYKIIE